MKEYKITVWKGVDGRYWYTSWYRKMYFLFRGRWKVICPSNQPTYEDAINLLNKENKNTK